MAKPNYDFAKRQRELAKKAKKEEKLRKKAAGIADDGVDDATDDADSDAPEVIDGAANTTTDKPAAQ